MWFFFFFTISRWGNRANWLKLERKLYPLYPPNKKIEFMIGHIPVGSELGHKYILPLSGMHKKHRNGCFG